LFVKPEGAGLYAQDADGNVALIGVSVDETDSDGNKTSVIKLTADNIQLEGLVTANGWKRLYEEFSSPGVPDHKWRRRHTYESFTVTYDPYDFGSERAYSLASSMFIVYHFYMWQPVEVEYTADRLEAITLVEM